MPYQSTPTYTFSVPGFTRGVKWLILSCLAVFILQEISWHGVPPLQTLFTACALWTQPMLFLHGAIWQPVTYLFLHESPMHLFWNMLGLWMFGVAIEESLGTRKFLTLYFISGVGAGLIDLGLHMLWPSPVPSYTIGASGAVFGILLGFGLLFPNQPVFLMLPPVTIKAKWLVLAWGILEFLFAIGNSADNVSHVAHLGGMLFAFLYLKSRTPAFHLREQYNAWRRRRLQRRFEVYMSRRDRHDGGPNGGTRWMH